jgi:hypothetical protein
VSATNRRVLVGVHRWVEAYQRGAIPTRRVRPPLSPGERLAARIFPVRVSREEAGRPLEQWAVRPGARALRPPFRNDGTLYATSARLYTVRHPKRGEFEVTREWSWGEVASVEVVPNWRGVSLSLRDDVGHLVVVGNVFHTFLVRPNPVALALGWLQVVGAWQESRGALESWLRVLDEQLARRLRAV